MPRRVSSLQASGLERYGEERSGCPCRPVPAFAGTGCPTSGRPPRWQVEDLAVGGVPRTRIEVAAVRAGLWARTVKQAAYLLTLVVQQGLTAPDALRRQLLRIRRDRRRTLLHTVVHDLLDGARHYPDLHWPRWRLVLEIDGTHHAWAANVIGDALRQNSLALQGDTILRLPLLGLRLAPGGVLRAGRAGPERSRLVGPRDNHPSGG